MQVVQRDQAEPENFFRLDQVTDVTARKFPIEENCTCQACREFSRGYIRHLIKAEEILGLRLITLHNLHFYLNLMSRARTEIESGTFDQFRKAFVAEYKTRDAITVV